MTNATISAKQRKAAIALLAMRPAVLPGTCAIIDEHQAKDWHDRVASKCLQLDLKPEQVETFCDVAGVAT
jgi:hypothetical protein